MLELATASSRLQENENDESVRNKEGKFEG